MTTTEIIQCACPMRGAGDAQGCIEVALTGQSPQPGHEAMWGEPDPLGGGPDGVITSPAVWLPGMECECVCHDD